MGRTGSARAVSLPGRGGAVLPALAGVRAALRVAGGRRAVLAFTAGYAALALLMSILVAPFDGLDEAAHYFRTVAIAQGGLRPVAPPAPARWPSRGGMVDAAAPAVERAFDKGAVLSPPHETLAALARGLAVRAAGRNVYARHSNTAIYPPFMYLPQAAAVALARAAGLGPLAWLYAARFAGALCFCLLLWLGLRMAGEAAPALAFVAVLPIPVFQATTLTCDTLLLGGSFVATGFLSRVLRGAAIGRRHLLLALLATVLVAAGKIAYLGVALAPLLLAWLAGRRALLAPLAGMAAVAVAVFAGWTLAMRHHVVPVRFDMVADPALQLRWMAAHPAAAARIVGESATEDLPHLLVRMVGKFMGHNDIRLPLKATVPLLLVLGWLVAVRVRVRANVPAALVLFALFLGSYLVITAMLYLQWSAVGAPRVDGVQGRYLLPLVLPFLALPLPLPLPAAASAPAVGGGAGRSVPLPALLLIGALPLWEVWRCYWLG